MDKIKPLFTATATATGGRNGHTQTSDGIVKADLSVPKDMGGPALSISSASSTRRTQARPRSPPRFRSARARAAASACK
jgi:hypothetical protein